MTEAHPPRRSLWRAIAVASVPAMVVLWALWCDLYLLEAGGISRVGGPGATAEWTGLSVATIALAALFWVGQRSLRVLAYTLYALVLAVAAGVAAVLGVMHAFGGPDGDLAAPAWALVGLAASAALAVASLLATAALIVEDVRGGDVEGEKAA